MRLLVLLLCLGCARQAAAPAERRVVLSVVATNDLHGHLESLPWFSGHLANLRAARAADGGGVVLVDAGDLLQGTLESNLGEGEAVVRAYGALGYTAVALGNHEFDFGPVGPAAVPAGADQDPRGALRARTAEARFPVLAANLREGTDPPRWPNVQPSVLVSVAGVRVGVVGLTTMDTPRATHPRNFVGLTVSPLAETLTAEARGLRGRGAQVVIAVAHAGGRCHSFRDPDDLSSCRPDEEIFTVARALPQGAVQVIAAGHTHQGVAHRVAGIPIVESFSYGRAFGRVDLVVGAGGRVLESRIHPPRFICGPPDHPPGVARSTPELSASACRPGPYEGRAVAFDQKLAALLEPAFAAARARRSSPVGVTLRRPFRRAYEEESALGNLVADLMRTAGPPAQLALTNGGGLRADLPAGPLTYGALYRALPFDNAFALVHLDAATLGKVVARNLARGRSIVSIAGVRARARCEGARLQVEILAADGVAMEPTRKLTMATSDYLAAGGDGLFDDLPVSVELAGGEPIREAVARRLRAHGGTLDPGDYEGQSPRIEYPGRRPVRCR